MTPADIIAKKQKAEPIAMLTAYDFPTAKLLEEIGIDLILVGDSLGMVVLGYDSTVPVTMDEMLHHAKAVCRGAKNSLVIGDMPYLSYQIDIADAVRNAGRFVKEAGCSAVKMEGGSEYAEHVRALVRAGIPVMAHIGLTPQTATALGGYKVQGKDLESAKKIWNDAKILAKAGAFAILLECVPEGLAKKITDDIEVPTIGIGAGRYCDGQVLVFHDLVGLYPKFTPKFAKKYIDTAPIIKKAVEDFKNEVKNKTFPESCHSFTGNSKDIEEMLELLTD